ncbi:hypothetical protein JQ035_00935 [Clostridium botulinum]|nr:hypothetical protein [Clostridium botulinum]
MGFAELNLDLASKQAKIDIKKGAPHVYFSDNYASILIRDTEGNTVYAKDFIGDKENETLIKNIDIKAGYYITIKHQESDNRLLITNTENELELEKSNSITYKITDDGLKNHLKMKLINHLKMNGTLVKAIMQEIRLAIKERFIKQNGGQKALLQIQKYKIHGRHLGN